MANHQVLSSTIWAWNGEDLIMLIGSNKIGEGRNARALERVLGSTESLLGRGRGNKAVTATN